MNTSRSQNRTFREWRREQAYKVLPVFPPIGRSFINGLGSTLRTRFTGYLPVLDMVRSGEPVLLAVFHGRQFLIVHQLKGWPLVIMTSISYIGDIQARILNSYGYTTLKGSSTKGGARVLASMVDHLRKKGGVGTFAVDGPRGPYRLVKPGTIYIAKKLGIPLVPVSTSAWPSWVMDSLWDKYLLPMPFSKCVVHFGEPFFLDEDLSDNSIEQACRDVGTVLAKLENEADALTGRKRT